MVFERDDHNDYQIVSDHISISPTLTSPSSLPPATRSSYANGHQSCCDDGPCYPEDAVICTPAVHKVMLITDVVELVAHSWHSRNCLY